MTKASRKKAKAAPRAPASPAPAHVPRAEARSRRALGAGALLVPAGLALVGTGPSDAGMVLTLVGLLTLIFGVHTYGRLGPP